MPVRANVYRLTTDQRYPEWGREEMVVTPRDARLASANDPLHCTIANAGRRATGAVEVIVLRTKAMFVFRDEAGHYHVEHYALGPASRTVMAATDRAKTGLGVGVTLDFRPIKPSAQPIAKRLRNERRPAGRAARPGSRPNAGQRADPLTLLGIRRGSPHDFVLTVPEPEPVPETIPLKRPWQTGQTTARG